MGSSVNRLPGHYTPTTRARRSHCRFTGFRFARQARIHANRDETALPGLSSGLGLGHLLCRGFRNQETGVPPHLRKGLGLPARRRAQPNGHLPRLQPPARPRLLEGRGFRRSHPRLGIRHGRTRADQEGRHPLPLGHGHQGPCLRAAAAEVGICDWILSPAEVRVAQRSELRIIALGVYLLERTKLRSFAASPSVVLAEEFASG